MSSPTDTDTAAHDAEESGPDRRSIIKAAALVAVPVAGVGVVAGCSSSNSKSDTSPGGSGSSGGSGGGNTPVQLATSDVPVGGGKVVESAKVVVCQPSAGVYKAFSAVCTHAGCTVSNVSNNQIHCPCHGSVFSATDGSVINGPASQPLGALTAKVDGSTIDVTGAAS
jgi:Rieske Fe-S protein